MKDGQPFRARLDEAKQASLAHLLVRAARLVNEAGLRRVQEDARFESARSAHLSVFPHLDLDGTRVTELARRMGITKQAVSQLIDDLEGLGMVERRPDPDDRRAKRVVFTNEGRAMMLFGLSVLRSIDDAMLIGLSPSRQKRFREDLLTITGTLETLAP